MGRGNQKAICILGMHRSGTSAVARAINLLGAYIGREDQLMPPQEDNPNGFWEHMAIYSFHERVLKFLARSWDTPSPMPEEWWKQPGIAPYRQELIELVRREFGDRPIWTWKDPRTSLVLPLWKDSLQELDIDVCYLHCLRNPLDVAASLKKRNGFLKNRSFALWLLYTILGFHWTHGASRMIIHYDRLLEDWEGSLKKVSEAFDLPWPEDDHGLREAMSGSLKVDSRHHHAVPNLLSSVKEVPETVMTFYRSLKDAEENRNLLDVKPFEETVSELFMNYASLDFIPKTSILPSIEQLTLNETGLLHFDPVKNPQVSIIIPVWNQWKYTYRCLESLLQNTDEVPYEVILVDNGSSDETVDMLMKVVNIKIIRKESNLGFVLACNDGAQNARGDYLLFLNNDTIVTKGWLQSMVELINSSPTIGAVGAKLVYPDGRLQEAGGMIFSDGRGWKFGNGDDPEKEIYNQICEVDYCSGACLLVRRSLFSALGGFDVRYSPAYYEESDLCFALRRMGYKVLYHPRAVVIHYESVTVGKEASSDLRRYIEINRKKFIEKWEIELVYQDEHPSITGKPPVTANRERLAETSTIESRAKTLKHLHRVIDTLTEDRDAWKRACSVSETDRAARLEVIERQGKECSEKIQELEADRAARLEIIHRQAKEFGEKIAELEADRAARLEFMHEQAKEFGEKIVELEADRDARIGLITSLSERLQASEADRAARLEVIERQAKEFSERVAELKASTSWRITAPFRRILDRWNALKG